jgi:hypothetical protein
MGNFWFIFLFNFILISVENSWAQDFFSPPFGSFVPEEFSIISHYPETAFISQRLLPFSIQGNGEVQISSVRVTRGESCRGFADPFHNRVLHLFCRRPDLMVAEVVFSTGLRENLIFIIGPLRVMESQAPIAIEGEGQ